MSARRVALGCALIGGLAVAIALVLALTSSPTVVTGGAAVPTVASGTLPVTHPPATPASSAAPPAAGARLRLPRLHLDARVSRVALDGSVMQVPRNPAEVGWWTGGPVPGGSGGSAVIVGHVNYGGVAGAFGVLPRARPGDLVTLSHPSLRFRVAAVRSYPKSHGLPSRIFTPGGPAQLVLITCGGSFDASTGNYRDNVVVYAVRA